MQMVWLILNVQEIEYYIHKNKYETYSTKEHKDKIKRPSNPRGTYKKNKK